MEEIRTNGRIPQLDGMRLVALFIIVLSHMEFFDKNGIGKIYWNFFHNATFGVDYFIILSGFGIFKKYKQYCFKNPVLDLNFGLQRIKKIYPYYLLSMIIVIPYYISNLCISQILKKFGAFLLCSTMMQTLFGSMAISHLLNGVGWFLSVLFLFYIFTPLCIKCMSLFDTHKKILLSIFLTLSSIILLSYLFSVFELHMQQRFPKEGFWNDFVYGSPYIRIFYYLLGMEIALLSENINIRIRNVKIQNIYGVLMTLVFISYFLLRNMIKINICELRIIDLIFDVIIFISLVYGNSFIVRALSNQYLVLFSKKYGMIIYLFHYPIRLYVGKINICGSYPILKMFIIILIMIFFIISYYLLEKYKGRKHG